MISATGNITGGNLVTSGIISSGSSQASSYSASGNITGGNILTSGLISATSTITSAANITGGNVLTGGLVSATGNITGGNVNVSTSGVLTVPRILFNDGGIRTLTGNTAVTLDFSTDSMVSLTNPTNTVTITLQNYVAGAVIRFIYSSATARQINTGVAAAVNSTTGAANITAGAGGIGPNQSVILTYYCVGGTAATTYVAASYQ